MSTEPVRSQPTYPLKLCPVPALLCDCEPGLGCDDEVWDISIVQRCERQRPITPKLAVSKAAKGHSLMCRSEEICDFLESNSCSR